LHAPETDISILTANVIDMNAQGKQRHSDDGEWLHLGEVSWSVNLSYRLRAEKASKGVKLTMTTSKPQSAERRTYALSSASFKTKEQKSGWRLDTVMSPNIGAFAELSSSYPKARSKGERAGI
jgi:hypothetical protein